MHLFVDMIRLTDIRSTRQPHAKEHRERLAGVQGAAMSPLVARAHDVFRHGAWPRAKHAAGGLRNTNNN
jgi:hypothetical protein